MLGAAQGKKVGTSVCEMSGRELPLGIVAAADVASAIVALLEQQSPSGASSSSSSTPQQGSFTALHIASDERPTWCDLVRMFAHELRVSGMQVPNVRFTDNKDSGFVWSTAARWIRRRLGVDWQRLDAGAAQAASERERPMVAELHACSVPVAESAVAEPDGAEGGAAG